MYNENVLYYMREKIDDFCGIGTISIVIIFAVIAIPTV